MTILVIGLLIPLLGAMFVSAFVLMMVLDVVMGWRIGFPRSWKMDVSGC